MGAMVHYIIEVIKCPLYITKVLSFNLFPLQFASRFSHFHHLLRSTNSTISQSPPLAAMLEAVGLVWELTGVHSDVLSFSKGRSSLNRN